MNNVKDDILKERFSILSLEINLIKISRTL